MDAVTYPDPKVAQFINENMVPLRVPFDHPQLSQRFTVKWTPTLITLDLQGIEHHRTLGFLNPYNLLASLSLAIAKVHFDRDRLEEALELLQKVTADYPQSEAAAEALYLSGVARYKITHEAAPLKEAYHKLKQEFPQSEWTLRAEPYRLL